MEIKKIIKKCKVCNEADYNYFLLFSHGNAVYLRINYMNKIWFVFSEDVHEVEKLRELFYQMLQSKECIDRLKFILIDPEDIIFMPSDMNLIK